MKYFMGPTLILFSFFCAAAYSASPDVFSSPTAGFKVTKPGSWHYLSAAQNLDNLRATQLDDEELHAAMLKYSTTPLVAMTKYTEPYNDLNPSFKVNIRALGQLKGRSATDLIAILLPQLRKAFPDLELVQPPVETEVDGMKTGYARFNYLLRAGGAAFPTTSELWVIPRGDYFFMIGAGTRQDEKNGSRKEIDAIIRTVAIAR